MEGLIRALSVTSAFVAAAALSGCNQDANNKTFSEYLETARATADHDHSGHHHGVDHDADADHHHHTEGPHGGRIVELGHGDYHAELVHDESQGTVCVYILDHLAAAVRPIESDELMINVRHRDRAEQFRLAAADKSSQQEGAASCFVSDSDHLHRDLHIQDVEARLVVKIANKSYTVDLDHEHHH